MADRSWLALVHAVEQLRSLPEKDGSVPVKHKTAATHAIERITGSIGELAPRFDHHRDQLTQALRKNLANTIESTKGITGVQT